MSKGLSKCIKVIVNYGTSGHVWIARWNSRGCEHFKACFHSQCAKYGSLVSGRKRQTLQIPLQHDLQSRNQVS